jgi:hypothetical protein
MLAAPAAYSAAAVIAVASVSIAVSVSRSGHVKLTLLVCLD